MGKKIFLPSIHRDGVEHDLCVSFKKKKKSNPLKTSFIYVRYCHVYNINIFDGKRPPKNKDTHQNVFLTMQT